MISRRKLLGGAAALGGYVALGGGIAKATPSVIAGAIRWDAWYATTRHALQAQNALGPQQYQFRAPWFSQVLNPYQISAQGSQANMDSEIAAAKNAGLKYWAFDYYSPTGIDSEFSVAWSLYQSSATKNNINWCWTFVDQAAFGSTGNFSTQVATFVSHFQQSNYQKVLSNRPLVYMFFTTPGPTFGNSLTNFNAMITALRSAAVSAGLGTPYIVIMGGVPDNFNFMTSIGGDAISAYIGLTPSGSQPNSAAALNTSIESYWTQLVGTGAKVIPPCASGWDVRPRKQNPPSFVLGTYIPPYSALLNYTALGTPSQVATQIQDCVNFIAANAAACETTAMIIYSWTECDEGGNCLIPTIGDPLQAGNTTNMLTAIGTVLN